MPSASCPKVPSPWLVALVAFFEVLVALCRWVSSFSGFYRTELLNPHGDRSQILEGSTKVTKRSKKATEATNIYIIRLQKLLKVSRKLLKLLKSNRPGCKSY